MDLPSELVLDLVKATRTKEKTKTEATVYGTIIESDGTKFVQIDGSELLTPVSTTANMHHGERVTVMIKNHNAIVTGNISSPAARIADVEEVESGVSEIDLNKADQIGVDSLAERVSDCETGISGIETDISGIKTDIENLSYEEGISGIWFFRKWGDGDVELFGTYSISNLACETEMGALFRSDVVSPGGFPFPVYNPNVVASYESDGFGALLWATTTAKTTQLPSYYLVRPESATITSGKINFYVIGKWTT